MRHGKKKRGSLLGVKPKAPFSIHTVVYHQKRFLPRKKKQNTQWMKGAFPLDAANHGWGFRSAEAEEFNFIFSFVFDSIAHRKRGFTAI